MARGPLFEKHCLTVSCCHTVQVDEAVSGAASHARDTRAQFVALTKSLLDRLDRNPELMEPALRGFVHGFSSLHTDAAVAGEIVTNTRACKVGNRYISLHAHMLSFVTALPAWAAGADHLPPRVLACHNSLSAAASRLYLFFIDYIFSCYFSSGHEGCSGCGRRLTKKIYFETRRNCNVIVSMIDCSC